MAGPLPNAKQEKYAKARAMGMMPSKAAVASGYMAGSSIATNLERHPDVQARMEELAAENADRRQAAADATKRAAEVVGEITGVTHAWVIRELVQLIADAKADGDYKEANAALKMVGEHLGMWGKMPQEGDPGAGQTAGAIAEAALDRMERLNANLAQLDPPTPPEQATIPDMRTIDALVGRQPATPKAELLTGTEVDVLQTVHAEPSPAALKMMGLSPDDIPL